jgi:hypothetical protein
VTRPACPKFDPQVNWLEGEKPKPGKMLYLQNRFSILQDLSANDTQERPLGPEVARMRTHQVHLVVAEDAELHGPPVVATVVAKGATAIEAVSDPNC